LELLSPHVALVVAPPAAARSTQHLYHSVCKAI
jgi:hypothetical protein